MLEHILATLAAWLVSFVSATGYAGVAGLMFIDAANIPAPSELTLPFTGYLVSTGRFSFWPAVLVATIGYTLGALVSYWIGYRGGRRFVERYGKWVLISGRDLDIGDRLFKKYGAAIAFFSRFVPVLRTFVSLPAGIARMPIKTYAAFTFAGAFLWSLIFVWLGQRLGDQYATIRERFAGVDKVAVAVVVLLGVAWVVRFVIHQRADRRYEREQAESARKEKARS